MIGKKLGEYSELKFQIKAYKKGFIVSKPFGDNAQYDFIIDYNGTITRIQVRSTSKIKDGSYRISARYGKNGAKRLDKRAIDFLLAYIVPEDIWYVVPVEKINDSHYLKFKPGDENCPTEQYRENWKLESLKPIKYLTSSNGCIYKTKYGYQIRFGRNITRHAKTLEDAQKCVEKLKLENGFLPITH